MTFDYLIECAKKVLAPRQIASNAWTGSVASALLSEKGNASNQTVSTLAQQGKNI